MARHPHAAAHSCWRSLTASSLSSSKSFPTNLLPTSLPFRSSSHRPVAAALSHSLAIDAGSCSFTWDDVVQVSRPESAPNDTSDLRGFFDKIKFCNRGAETQNDFIRFFVDDQVVGYIHKSFCDSLRSYKDVFVFPNHRGDLYGYQAKLHPSLKRYDDRTRAVANVVRLLGEIKLIPGVRNELYPVTSSFGGSVFFSLERAAAPYFGIKAYGVHMNGYVEKNGQKFLWIGRRSQVKPTFPGMLDHLVAGGLPHGIPCGENLIKECEEEAGIPRSLSKSAIPVGAVSYVDINGPRYKRDVLFCYDLKLPEDFTPINQDGEVESFRLIPVERVANVVKRTQFFKPNCSIVIIDFLFRHGYIKPEFSGYLDLLQNLKSGDCSCDSKETFYVGPITVLGDLNQWPSTEALPSWRPTMEAYYINLLSAGTKLISLIALALNLEEDYFEKVGAMDHPMAFLRLLHYPGHSHLQPLVDSAQWHNQHVPGGSVDHITGHHNESQPQHTHLSSKQCNFFMCSSTNKHFLGEWNYVISIIYVFMWIVTIFVS